MADALNFVLAKNILAVCGKSNRTSYEGNVLSI
jgi:hypothetical protein